MIQRRAFLLGLTGTLAAPAIVRAESLMKIWVPPAPKLAYIDPNPIIGIIERFEAHIQEAVIQITGVNNLSLASGNWTMRGRIVANRPFNIGDVVRYQDLA